MNGSLMVRRSAWVSWVIIFANIYGLHNTATEVASDAAYTDRVRILCYLAAKSISHCLYSEQMYQVIEFLFFLTLVVSLEKIVLQWVGK